MSLHPTLLSALVCMLFVYTSGFSQSVKLTDLLDVEVCSDFELAPQILNDVGYDLDSISVTFALPCNFEYVVGSVTGGVESNITNLSSPQFDVSNLPAGDSVRVRILVRVLCDALSSCPIGVVTHDIQINSDAGMATYTSNLYNIFTGRLVIGEVIDASTSGFQGDIIQRDIIVRNTQLGRIGEFTFTDNHNGGVVISIDDASF